MINYYLISATLAQILNLNMYIGYMYNFLKKNLNDLFNLINNSIK